MIPRISLALLCAFLPTFTAPRPAPAQARDTAAVRLAGRDAWTTDFSRRAVPSREIRLAGVPKDGIPAIDRPRFESAEAAGQWLKDSDMVMLFEHGRTVRAYPFRILVMHEIVNDRVDDLPVAATFCPLCNTAVAFDRRVGERTLEFGVTGRLRHSDLVMYDRQTETWWQQATGEALVGTLVGEKLRRVPTRIVTWEAARKLFPTVRVLAREGLTYDRDPFAGYGSSTRQPWRRIFARGGSWLPPMERVVALDLGEGWAVSLATLRQRTVVNAAAEGTPFVVFWRDGGEMGQTAVYDRRDAGRTLTFRAVRGGFEDRQTGSRWDLAGRAVAGPLKGRRLRPLAHDHPFWFAWTLFRPKTRLWSP